MRRAAGNVSSGWRSGDLAFAGPDGACEGVVVEVSSFGGMSLNKTPQKHLLSASSLDILAGYVTGLFELSLGQYDSGEHEIVIDKNHDLQVKDHGLQRTDRKRLVTDSDRTSHGQSDSVWSYVRCYAYRALVSKYILALCTLVHIVSSLEAGQEHRPDARFKYIS